MNNLDTVQNKNLNKIIKQLSKTTESRELYKELIIVLAIVAALTPHSADVERCISAFNILKTKLRSRLSLRTENKYLYIRMNMPVLSEWNPAAAAKLFLEDKVRRNRDVTSSSEVSKRQNYFKGVFIEANQSKENVVSENDDAHKETVFLKFEF